MKQVTIKKGVVSTQLIPAPQVEPDHVLIEVNYSCISSGTETTAVKSSGKSIFKRVIDKPKHVVSVASMVKEKGISGTIDSVKGKLFEETATGYSISGRIIEVGENVANYKVGDLVAAAGAKIANHAEYVSVPVNLVTKVSPGLSLLDASTVTLGGIAMQGIRRAECNLGEFALVVGAGILGLISVQLLKASGVKVAAVDYNQSRLDLAKTLGADLTINPSAQDYQHEISLWTNGFGVDKCIFTAATDNPSALSEAFEATRQKGTLVMVGVYGNIVDRNDIYKKEIDFKISTSYGPGRYDNNYEEKGLDYPYSYVRWTENRNMQEYINLLECGVVNVSSLISGIYHIDDACNAFLELKKQDKQPLMLILNYEDKHKNYKESKKVINVNTSFDNSSNKLNVGVIGAGAFVRGKHLPNLKKLNDKFNIFSIMNRTGLTAKSVAEEYGASYSTTDSDEVISNKDTDVVFIGTRHASHAELVKSALNNGKNVFLEKPLCVNRQQLNELKDLYNSLEVKPIIMVGFNRRFSPFAIQIKNEIQERNNPLYLRYRMNAGYQSKEHWVHEDGGRIIGEACHIIDLAKYIIDSEVESINVEQLDFNNSMYFSSDNKILTIKYKDGSVAVIEYITIPNKRLNKEYMEIHIDGKTIIMDDYKTLTICAKEEKVITLKNQDKGHLEELNALYYSVKNGTNPISFDSIVETTELSFIAANI